MVIARTWGAVRIRKYRTLPFIATPVWPAAFYWPLYVWGLQAPHSLWYQLFAGANYSNTKLAYEGIAIGGWTIIYASVLPLLLIAHFGAAAQGLVNEFRCTGAPWHISLPFPVIVAVLSVYFVESAWLVLFGEVALLWRP
jgi:hypothetical protein